MTKLDSKFGLAMLENIFEISKDAIIIADTDGNVVGFNPAAEDMFRHKARDVIGRDMAPLIIPERMRKAHHAGMSSYLATGVGPVLGQRIEVPAIRADGSEFPAELTVQSSSTSEGEVFIAFMRDISDRKQTEDELTRAKDLAEVAAEAKSGFLAVMSHEIRTPLNGVLGVLSLLKDTSLDDKQLSYIRTARESGEALLTIISDILDFTKMEAGKLDFDEIAFDPAEVTSGVVDLFQPTSRRTGVKLAVEIGKTLPIFVKGDPGRLRQVIMNLVGNALKFTKYGSVKVRASCIGGGANGQTIRVEVEDSGIGIPEERIPEIFKEFTSLDVSRSRRFGGTGLGLAISKRLVEMMDGEIGVSSVVDQGTVFWFHVSLPIPTDEEIAEIRKIREHSEAEVSEDETPPARVLMAEDNVTNALVGRAMLEKAGHKVDIACNGIEAVEAVQAFPYDLVFMDVNMPDMDGIEATQIIRGLPNDVAGIPIIALTALAMKGDRERILQAGLNDYIQKPVKSQLLLSAVERWLGKESTAKLGSYAEETNREDWEFDVSKIQELNAEIGADKIPKLLDIFIKDTGNRLELVKLAAREEDTEVLEQQAHTLASSTATYGCIKCGKLAMTIEQNCRAGDARAALDLVEEFEKAIEGCFSSLATYLANQEE